MPAMLGAATEVPPTSPASANVDWPELLVVNSQTPSLQKIVASWPSAAFSTRSGVRRCGTPVTRGGCCSIGPRFAVPVAVVPEVGAPNTTLGTTVQLRPCPGVTVWPWVPKLKVICASPPVVATEPPLMAAVAPDVGKVVQVPPLKVTVVVAAV